MMLDHIVYAVPDLAAAVVEIGKRLGVGPSPGGRHPGVGTRNALLSLGDDAYLEVIGPGPDQPSPVGPRPFGIDDLRTPRIATWMAKAPNIEAMVAKARAAGYALGNPRPRSRELPDGSVLRWRLATPENSLGDGVLPSLIEWQTDRHPSKTAAQGCRLLELRAEHPTPEALTAVLRALGLSLQIEQAPSSALVALIEAPAGQVELR